MEIGDWISVLFAAKEGCSGALQVYSSRGFPRMPLEVGHIFSFSPSCCLAGAETAPWLPTMPISVSFPHLVEYLDHFVIDDEHDGDI